MVLLVKENSSNRKLGEVEPRLAKSATATKGEALLKRGSK